MEFVKGQLLELTHVGEKTLWWEYGVVIQVFDDRVEVLRENRGRYMHTFSDSKVESELIDNQKSKTLTTVLKRDGKIVMGKKSLFGRYLPKPQKH